MREFAVAYVRETAARSRIHGDQTAFREALFLSRPNEYRGLCPLLVSLARKIALQLMRSALGHFERPRVRRHLADAYQNG